MVKRIAVGLSIVFATCMLIAGIVKMNQQIGSGRFGLDSNKCKERMENSYVQIKKKLSLGSGKVTSETVAQFCGTECECSLAKGTGNTGWTWRPDLQRSDFVAEGPRKPSVILCHSPDFPHGTGDPRLWLVMLSDGSVRKFWCDLVVYREWYVDVFMDCKDGLPESVL